MTDYIGNVGIPTRNYYYVVVGIYSFFCENGDYLGIPNFFALVRSPDCEGCSTGKTASNHRRGPVCSALQKAPTQARGVT